MFLDYVYSTSVRVNYGVDVTVLYLELFSYLVII